MLQVGVAMGGKPTRGRTHSLAAAALMPVPQFEWPTLVGTTRPTARCAVHYQPMPCHLRTG